MNDLVKVDELLHTLIETVPTLNNKNEWVKQIEIIDINHYINVLEENYKQFELWMNELLESEKIQDEIVALNYGLYETEYNIQLYVTGANEWELDDDDWACKNDYFPEGRYPSLKIYNYLYNIMENDFETGLFITIASTIILVNTYADSNSTKLLSGKESLVLATGFDDGDLYSFSKLTSKGIVSIKN
jgi:hypothetical protein